MIRLRPGLLATLIAALVAVFLLMPLLAVIPVSFTPRRMLSVPSGGRPRPLASIQRIASNSARLAQSSRAVRIPT